MNTEKEWGLGGGAEKEGVERWGWRERKRERERERERERLELENFILQGL